MNHVTVIKKSGDELDFSNTRHTMGDSNPQLRQPKKRFVGRRTADAEAQKDPSTQKDVESTSVQKGMPLTTHWL